MSDTLAVQVGNKGRVVVPASIRARHAWVEGSTLVALDTELGVLLADQGAVERLVRARLSGHDLLAELLDDRRREAARDNETQPGTR
ncbi:AbrB/MazE/SpoVT family DNA-binding domain-containing protein [Microcella humidisoli]|uniref:AbrB/MazE/SpoVT family DNA-binding domain-containing protein n=1 Tax=Microcella humidisoli TaxID=2963406 RepID=A0ABY5FW29_9MICO|nr:AbrB/MazE/SpoVT family DNA-binding domain-containing protein [Microcella humidisoli]UTT62147.1 AbrB/MazE/SpoVT family DNA-binding domain-containing protein [Microcella humidisoli]